MIVILAGGTGAAKFIRGLLRIVPQERLAIIVNTGDDLDWWGLRVCPDIDTITYCLAGILDQAKGWGVAGDTFHCLAQIRRLGLPTWFKLGDRDLATQLYRTRLLGDGQPLSAVTREIARRLGATATILPMSDQLVRTVVHTPRGELSFQEFFVRDRFEPAVDRVEYRMVGDVRAGPGVRDALAGAEGVIIAPSNPITSIGPILAVPGVRVALAGASAPVVAVSPIVGEKAVSGPAGKLMAAAGWEVSAAGVAAVYRDLLDTLVADRQDEPQRDRLEAMGVTTLFTDTIMKDDAAAEHLARVVLRCIERKQRSPQRRQT